MIHLTEREKRHLREIASKMFDEGKVSSDITPKQAYILGFVQGREYTLDQLGVFDDEETEDEKIYQFIKDHEL